MTVKVKNTMQPSKLLFFILIVLLVPISSSEQQEEECTILDDFLGECVRNFTIPEPRETTTKECSITGCVEKTIRNGTFSFEECNEKGECTTITKKNENTTTSEWTFPKLW